MNIIRVLFGLIVFVVGAAVGYVDYLLVRAIFITSTWISSMLHAPEAVGALFGVVIGLFFLTIMIVLLVIAIAGMAIGLMMVFSD